MNQGVADVTVVLFETLGLGFTTSKKPRICCIYMHVHVCGENNVPSVPSAHSALLLYSASRFAIMVAIDGTYIAI